MYKWLVEYWKEFDDVSADFYMIVEARNAEEACEIASHRERCGKNFLASVASASEIKMYDR